MLGDLRELTKEKLQEGTVRMNNTEHILEIAGTPCQDLSGANVSGKGLSGTRSSSSLFFELEAKAELYRASFPATRLHRLLENVASMKVEDRTVISKKAKEHAAQTLP